MTKRIIIIALLLLALLLLLIRPIGPVYGQDIQGQEEDAMQDRLFIPLITNPFGGSVPITCPIGSDATVHLEAYTKLPGLFFGVWSLYDHEREEGFLSLIEPYIIFEGYGAASIANFEPMVQVLEFNWFSSTPMRVTGTGCYYVDEMPLPPN